MKRIITKQITGKCYCYNKQNTVKAKFQEFSSCGDLRTYYCFIGLESNELCNKCLLEDDSERYEKCEIIKKVYVMSD